jgi:hypothetical protein
MGSGLELKFSPNEATKIVQLRITLLLVWVQLRQFSGHEAPCQQPHGVTILGACDLYDSAETKEFSFSCKIGLLKIGLAS